MQIAWSKIPRLLKSSGSDFMEDNCMTLGAAMAYYAITSIAPLLLLVLAIAGFVFGKEAASGQLNRQIEQLMGSNAGQAVEKMLATMQNSGSNTAATVIGAIFVLLGASGVFASLQSALNQIWGVAPRPGRGIIGIIKDRALSFAMVLGILLLLLASVVISTALATIGKHAGHEGMLHYVFWTVELLVSVAVVTALFMAMFKVLPDVELTFRDVWVGAAVTAILFTIGKWLIGLYLGHAGTASAYGAAGAPLVLLVWIYYSSLILFFGAEFTKVYATEMGTKPEPSANAIPTTREMRAHQGMPTDEDQRLDEQEQQAAREGRFAEPDAKPMVIGSTSQPEQPQPKAAGKAASVAPGSKMPAGRRPIKRQSSPWSTAIGVAVGAAAGALGAWQLGGRPARARLGRKTLATRASRRFNHLETRLRSYRTDADLPRCDVALIQD